MQNKLSEFPLVSVIITTYNRKNLLIKAVKSVLSQTYKRIELIIVDDCSTDGTNELIKTIDDERVKCIHHTDNMGVHQSRNDGILNSNGEYIAFLDDDDEWLPKKIERQLHCFMNSDKELGLVYTGYYTAINGEIKSRNSPKRRGYLREILTNQNLVATSTVLTRSICFKKVGLFEYMPFVEDWDMWMRISEFFEFDYVPEPLCIYNIHVDQVTSNPMCKIIGQEIMLNKYYELWKNTPNRITNSLNSLGKLYYFTNYKKQSKKFFIESLRIKFFQRSCFIDLLMSKFLIKHFPATFNINNTSISILKLLIQYLRSIFWRN